MKVLFVSLLIFISLEGSCELIQNLQVEKVIDGDTVYGSLNGKTYKLRLTEIDAPERNQPFGRQSKVFLRELLKDGEFNADISGQDQYGRYLARLYDNGVDINRKMVSEGMAWVYDDYVTDKTFYQNQQEAQEQKKGLWSKRYPAPPWEWRRARRR
tara:strand:+ start:1055 stop:1522 length:468 start_codon:yes stop_codon:yes gene_type:complete